MVLHLLLCILCSALVYLWFLSSCIVPAGMTVLDIDKISAIGHTVEELPR